MARAITMRHTIVTADDRSEFRNRAGRSRQHYMKAGCHYWLFEEADLAGAFLEFFEAGDRETLVRAHRDAPEPVAESARLYVEVELT